MATEGDINKLDLVRWLAKIIKESSCPGLKLREDSAGKFTIPWKNEKSGGLKPGDANTLFVEAWAKHKNYQPTEGEDAKDLRNWKEKFRNSLNSSVKKAKNIRRLKNEDTADYIVCQFDETFLLNNFPIHQGEGHTFPTTPNSELELTDGSFVSQSDCPTEISNQLSMSELECDTYLSYVDFEDNTNTGVSESSFTSDNSVPQENASNEIAPVLDISITYGIPHSHVGRLVLESNNPACRLFYPSCVNPGVQNCLRQNSTVIHHELPSVGSLPEFNKEQKGIILKILDKMDRGLYLRYQSGNVYAERRDAINVFVTSDLYQRLKLSRRKSRHDDPHEIKVFDYQNYMRRLEQYQGKHISHPPMAKIIFNFGLIELSNMSHVMVIVNHRKASEVLDNVLSTKGPLAEISSSQEDDLDHLMGALSKAASCDGDLPTDHPGIEALQTVLPLIGESLENRSPMPMDTENGPEIDIPKPPDAPVLMIDVYCDKPNRSIVKKYLPKSKTLCRIFSGDTQILLPWDNFNENVETLSLPNSIDSSDSGIAQKISTILNKLQRGLHVKYDKGDIYVERRCPVDVYHTDGVCMSQRLTRRNANDENDHFVKVFDYEQFKQSLEEFKKRPVGPLPRYELKLTLGNKIHQEYSNPMINILFYVSIFHIEAYHELCTSIGYSVEEFNPLQSVPDSIDRILQFAKDFTKGNDVQSKQ